MAPVAGGTHAGGIEKELVRKAEPLLGMPDVD